MSIGSDGNLILGFLATSSKVTCADVMSQTFGGWNTDGFLMVPENRTYKIDYASYLGGDGDDQYVASVGPQGNCYVAVY
jgi:hypothetical protein